MPRNRSFDAPSVLRVYEASIMSRRALDVWSSSVCFTPWTISQMPMLNSQMAMGSAPSAASAPEPASSADVRMVPSDRSAMTPVKTVEASSTRDEAESETLAVASADWVEGDRGSDAGKRENDFENNSAIEHLHASGSFEEGLFHGECGNRRNEGDEVEDAGEGGELAL